MPLENVEFDEHECNQPQERIPEVDEVTFYAPVDRRKQQQRIQHRFERVAELEYQTLVAIVFL